MYTGIDRHTVNRNCTADILIVLNVLLVSVFLHKSLVGLDSSVGNATVYGLDGPGTEYRCGARFPALVHTGPGAHPASYAMGTGSFPGIKRPGRSVDHQSSAEDKEKVELYFNSSSRPSWPVPG